MRMMTHRPSNDSREELNTKTLHGRHDECPVEVVVVLLARGLGDEKASVTGGAFGVVVVGGVGADEERAAGFFAITFAGCILGITLLAAALSKFLLVEMRRGEQWLCAVAALLMIAPGLTPLLLGAALAAPVVLRQVLEVRRRR